MTIVVNMHDAKTQLSRLVEAATAGEEVVIAKANIPVARLVPYLPDADQPRRPGGWEGRVRISPDFDELPEEVAAAFRGERP